MSRIRWHYPVRLRVATVLTRRLVDPGINALGTIKGLIFDFDGLIVDTETPAYQSWSEIFAEHSCSLPLSVWEAALGAAAGTFDAFGYLETQIGCTVDREMLAARRTNRKLELTVRQELLPGVRERIDEAKSLGLSLGVVSSSSRSWVLPNLERLGVAGAFDSIICREDAPRAKPHPDLYQLALSRFGIGPGEAIALEDSPNGVTAAVRAGIFCVAVPNTLTAHLRLDHANARLVSLADASLTELIALAVRDKLASRGAAAD
jgi:HAD superfamily hydrolase (TIGR01509 family)